MKVDDIIRLKSHYVDTLYAKTRLEQKIDQSYIDDTFDVPEVKAPHRVVRSGIGSRIINAPAEQIITSNPQAYFETSNKDVAQRLSKEINGWFDVMRLSNPNIFKEIVKNKLGRGESYIKVCHNESWVADDPVRSGLPIIFSVPDPMVVYGSPAEDNCGWKPNSGVPNEVIVFYERQPEDVIGRYPSWKDLKDRKGNKERVDWLEYWNKDIRYFEADGVPVLSGGTQRNIYGFTPFVRKYSGLGKRSHDGELAHLIMSDIRRSRDLIKEECITRSDIASIHHLFAHKPWFLFLPTGEEISEQEIQEMKFGAYALNVLHLPESQISKLQLGETPLPSAEMYAYLAEITSKIESRHPFIMAGFPFGTSGRQQDMTQSTALNTYYTIVENTENEFATAVEMGLALCNKVPTLKPEGLHEKDLEADFRCNVKLREVDPIERDRLVTLGDRLWSKGSGSIDLETNLIEFQGRTQHEARKIIAKILADRLTLYNPDVAEVMAMAFADESGMERWLEEAKNKRMMMEGQQKGLQEAMPATTEQRVKGEVETPLGAEMGTEPIRGGRISPQRYTRGGEYGA